MRLRCRRRFAARKIRVDFAECQGRVGGDDADAADEPTRVVSLRVDWPFADFKDEEKGHDHRR
jgi:hypothetical protein